MSMSKLHGSGTQWVRRDGRVVRDGGPAQWGGHAGKELARRRKARKVAKAARKRNR